MSAKEQDFNDYQEILVWRVEVRTNFLNLAGTAGDKDSRE